MLGEGSWALYILGAIDNSTPYVPQDVGLENLGVLIIILNNVLLLNCLFNHSRLVFMPRKIWINNHQA